MPYNMPSSTASHVLSVKTTVLQFYPPKEKKTVKSLVLALLGLRECTIRIFIQYLHFVKQHMGMRNSLQLQKRAIHRNTKDDVRV